MSFNTKKIIGDEQSSDTQDSFASAAGGKRRKKDFFESLRPKEPLVYDELDAYLSDSSTTITSVLKYPIITKIYRRYNTALPSSAAVERVFSTGGLIFKHIVIGR